MAFGSNEGPDLFDFAGFADEERTADDAHEGAAHELFFLPGAEFSDGFVRGIGEQRKIELVLGLERGLRFDGIGAHAEDGHTMLIELLLCVTKLGRFNGSTGGVGFGVEKEEDAMAAKIGEGEICTLVGFETEAGGFDTDLEHGFPHFSLSDSGDRNGGGKPPHSKSLRPKGLSYSGLAEPQMRGVRKAACAGCR